MNTIKKTLIGIFIYMLLCSYSFAQLDQINCALVSTASSTTPYKPTRSPIFGQYLKALIVHVTFPDDNNRPLYDNFWPAHQMPTNIDGNPVIWPTEGDPGIPFMDRYPRYTISDYFCEMSMGQLDVIGDAVHIELPNDSYWYRDQGYNYGSLNRLVLQLVDQQFPNINFADYDNWRFNQTTQQWEWAAPAGDGIVDMVVMSYRFIPSQGNPTFWFWFPGVDASGEASLGYGSFGSLMLDGKTLNGDYYYTGSGCTGIGQLLKYSAVTGIIEHEICHSFFVNNLNGYDTYHSWIGLMVGVNALCYNLSPYERSRPITGWNINPVNVIPSPSSQDFTLGDYIATGNMLRIAIPNSSEYFWVANHQKISLYDGISRGSKVCFDINGGGQDPYCGAGKGLFIYHENSNSCPNNHGMGFELEQADGKWNWTVDRMVHYWNPPPYFDLPLFEHISPNGGNPNNGYGEYLEYIHANNGEGIQNVSDDPCSDDPQAFFVTNDKNGDGLDGFNMVYDQIFSPYSNPRTNSCVNPEINSGLTIGLMSQNTNGDITVRIYFVDNVALAELPPSKPKNLKVTPYEYNPPTRAFHPKLNWDANTEPDFVTALGQPIPPARYLIYRGWSYDCQTEPTYSVVASVPSNVTEFIDNNVTLFPKDPSGPECTYVRKTYSYKITAVDFTNLQSLQSDRGLISGWEFYACRLGPGGNFVTNGTPEVPKEFSISNYPNPFNPATEIKYGLPTAELVTIKIFNLLGEVVAVLAEREFMEAGYHKVTFDGRNLASGVYFYRIEAGTFVDTKKMVMMK